MTIFGKQYWCQRTVHSAAIGNSAGLAGVLPQQFGHRADALGALQPAATGGIDLARTGAADGGCGLYEHPVGQCIAKAEVQKGTPILSLDGFVA